MKIIPLIAIIVLTTNGISGVAIPRPRQELPSTNERTRPTYDRCRYGPFSNLLSCQLVSTFEYHSVYPTRFGCSFTDRPIRAGQILVPSDALEADPERFAERINVMTAVETAQTVYTTETEIRETHHLHALGEHSAMTDGLTATRGDESETGGPETDDSQTDDSQTDDSDREVRSRNDPAIPTCSLWRRIDSPIYAYRDEEGPDQVELLFYEGNYQWFHMSSCHGSNSGPVVNCAGNCQQIRLQHRAVVVRPDLTAEWDWIWLDAGCTLHIEG